MYGQKDEEFDDTNDEVWDSEEHVIVLEDEEGQETRFKILFNSLFVGDDQYVVLMPIEEEEALEPEIVILRVDQDDGGKSILVTIDSNDEWERVLDALDKMELDGYLDDYEIELEDQEEPED
ncbi:MAG: DUF1292 domain-containing protein [Bacillota bacterium]|jgi:uncharacterized protein YrzB (UPF0473 family)